MVFTRNSFGVWRDVVRLMTRLCPKLLISWVFFGIGVYVYETAGLGYAFIPFAVTAALRIEQDRLFAAKLKQWRTFQLAALAYYFLLLLFALWNPRLLSGTSGTVLAIVMAFPLAIVVLINDFKTCFRTTDHAANRTNTRSVRRKR